MAQWENRIIGHGEEDPEQLLANPQNFRRHPGPQLNALRGSLNELGWVKGVLVNRTTGHVVDGHARVEEAMRQGQSTIPVDYVELSEAEERLALATLDPITEMATRDEDALNALLAEVKTDDAGLQALLDEMKGGESQNSSETSENQQSADSQEVIEQVTRPGDVWRLGGHELSCGVSSRETDLIIHGWEKSTDKKAELLSREEND